MASEDNLIKVVGKEINLSKLSDEKVIKLYEELKKKESFLYRRIMAYDKKYNLLSEISINDIM